MRPCVTVREYAHLTTAAVATGDLGRVQVSKTAFDWLCRLNQHYRLTRDAALVEVEDSHTLRLDNYVGVIETPCGTRLEILPKTLDSEADIPASRRLLQRMIAAALDLAPREAGVSALELFDAPLSEWVMAQFLAALDHLVKRGVRSDYLRVEAAERFLRGQLDVVRQMRQPPGRDHLFNIRHDIFVPDRAENRLLKLAVERVARLAQNSANWRLANELRGLLADIPPSSDVAGDFKRWRTDRLMAHYQPVKPWCELILYRQMPLSLQGHWHGISMLFPMEKLFERYVEKALRRDLADGAMLTAQAASEYLCRHEGQPMFQLKPDMLITQGTQRWILDAKWKRVNAAERSDKFGLSQADLYQLYAYGQKYLGGRGEMALIYPKWSRFAEPLEPFDFGDGLTLWVLPFDLEEAHGGRLLHGKLTNIPFMSAGVDFVLAEEEA